MFIISVTPTSEAQCAPDRNGLSQNPGFNPWASRYFFVFEFHGRSDGQLTKKF